MIRLPVILLLLCACAYAATPRALSNEQTGYKPMSVTAPQLKLVTIRVLQPVYQPNVDIGLVAVTNLKSTWHEICRTALQSNALYYDCTITNNGTQQFFRSFTDYHQ